MGSELPCLNTKRYLPPGRMSASQDTSETPKDFGTHHFTNTSGCVHALKTMRGGASKLRVTTSSRPLFRSRVVWLFMVVASFSRLPSIGFLLAFQFGDDLVQLVEACGPELAI